jgi:hypothetical protein
MATMVDGSIVDDFNTNELPRSKPRGINDRNYQEIRSKPRFLHLLSIEKSGLAAGYSHSAKAG